MEFDWTKNKQPSKLIMCLFMSICVGILCPGISFSSDYLKGRVEKKDNYFHITRPPHNLKKDQALYQPDMASKSQTSNISLDDFVLAGSSLIGKTEQVDSHRDKMLLGEDTAEDLLILWEEWHKKISKAIYTQWANYAPGPGEAHVTLTFRKDRSINLSVTRYNSLADYGNDGNQWQFIDAIHKAVQEINGSPDLAFPDKSKRKEVVLNACFRSNPYDTVGGYSFKRGDVERVRQR